MNRKLTQLTTVMIHKLDLIRSPQLQLVFTHWRKALFLGIVVFLIFKKDVSINLNLNAAAPTAAYQSSGVASSSSYSVEEETPRAMNTSQLNDNRKKRKVAAAKPKAQPPKPTDKGANLANTFSNLIFSAKDEVSEAEKKARAAKRKKQLAYVDRYAKVAKGEMEKYGVPASITLAQGLLESNVGESRLATKNKNHFGIKCFSKKCGRGHCSNFEDDSHKDFFRKYKSSWDSFRAHSKLLQAKRYKPLYELDQADYKGWAHGLKKAGYATDKAYATKLIGLIEDLELYTYDD